MNRLLIAAAIALAAPGAGAQMVVDGLVTLPATDGSGARAALNSQFVFASLPGPDSQALGYRTWDGEPVGWYRLSGSPGTYTMLFTNPASFARPILKTNVVVGDGEKAVVSVRGRSQMATLPQSDYDPDGGTAYYQPFVATGTSVTSVGFRLAHDGVDGEGGGTADFLVAILDGVAGVEPSKWKQIGPEMPVRGVDAGGFKNRPWSAGWNSGEVPTLPRGMYAVRIRPADARLKFQCFWRKSDGPGAFRAPAGYTGHDIWLVVSGDGDGLVVPYNKRIHSEYRGETRFARKWTQTYVAKGRGIAGVCLYTMFSGEQPGIARQRVRITLREGGPGGRVIGVPKIGIGSGNYTGDASWGAVGASFAPGEAPVVPGKKYAIEFETIESLETLSGFVNIKGFGNTNPGFHPYPKVPGDGYPAGQAFVDGKATDLDLDMQVVEYEHNRTDWRGKLLPANLVLNGSLQSGTVDDRSSAGKPAAWDWFAIDKLTDMHYLTDPLAASNRVARIVGGSYNGRLADGGIVQRVSGLDKSETYVASAKVRSTWAIDSEHVSMVGVDPTGQTSDPLAKTISWTSGPAVHGQFVELTCPPVRPESDSVSVWLRARTTSTSWFGFRADFDDITFRQIDTSVPPAR